MIAHSIVLFISSPQSLYLYRHVEFIGHTIRDLVYQIYLFGRHNDRWYILISFTISNLSKTFLTCRCGLNLTFCNYTQSFRCFFCAFHFISIHLNVNGPIIHTYCLSAKFLRSICKTNETKVHRTSSSASTLFDAIHWYFWLRAFKWNGMEWYAIELYASLC